MPEKKLNPWLDAKRTSTTAQRRWPAKLANTTAQRWWQPALIIFTKVSGWIVAPVLVALFVGKALDTRFDTEPWIFVGLIAFAFIISLVGIIRETMKSIKEIEKIGKENGDNLPEAPPSHKASVARRHSFGDDARTK